jgi:LPS sulfotransferase NodH
METSNTGVNRHHFVVVAHPRSGSTLLTSAVASHSSVQMYGEVFNVDADARAHNFPGDLRQWDPSVRRYRIHPRKRPYNLDENAADFLRQSVFYPRWRIPPLAIGFKIFYDHARETENQSSAWDYLTARPDLLVIHLYRENLVKSWLSLKLAEASSVWAVPQGERLPSSPSTQAITINAEECLRYCKRMLRWRHWARHAFQSQRYIELTYERDMCSDFAGSISRVQRFLSIPIASLEPNLQKQQRVPYSKTFPNYAQIIDHIRAQIPEALPQL